MKDKKRTIFGIYYLKNNGKKKIQGEYAFHNGGPSYFLGEIAAISETIFEVVDIEFWSANKGCFFTDITLQNRNSIVQRKSH